MALENRGETMTRLAGLLAALCLTLPVDAYGQVTLLHEFAGGANDGDQPPDDGF